MKEEKLYQIQVSVGTCKIETEGIKQASVMFRIGKSTSKLLDSKTVAKGKIIFDGKLMCSCDQSALSTQRISLTINLKNINGDSRIGGIIFVPINQHSMPTNVYKVSQSADKNSTMDIGVMITQIGGNQPPQIKNSGNVFLNQEQLKNPRVKQNPQQQKQNDQKLQINSLKVSNHNKSDQPSTLKVKSRIKGEDKSGDSKEVTVLWEQESISRIQPLNQDIKLLKKQIQTLKNQKNCLKQLLKLQMSKSEKLTKFIYKIQGSFYDNLIQNEKTANFMIRSTISNKMDKKTSFNKTGSTDLGQLKLSNKYSIKAPNIQLGGKHIQTPNFSTISQNLTTLLRQSLNQRGQSKNILQQFKKVVMEQKDLKTDRKLRSIKIKIQKAFMELLSQGNQNKTIQKEHILKHKQTINKILDELVVCQVN